MLKLSRPSCTFVVVMLVMMVCMWQARPSFAAEDAKPTASTSTKPAKPAKPRLEAASIFSSGMVLQRDRPLPIWGWSDPGETITVSFAGHTAKTKSTDDGKWYALLPACPANETGATLSITSSKNSLTFNDVLVGEVWLCSGQSNMVWEMRSVQDSAKEIASAKDPLIRAFRSEILSGQTGNFKFGPDYKFSPGRFNYPLTPQDRVGGKWVKCVAPEISNISGVAFFFAQYLRQRLNVPIGIVVSAQGATFVEAWISIEGLKAIPSYRNRAESFAELAKVVINEPEKFDEAAKVQQARVERESADWFQTLDQQDPGVQGKWAAPGHDDPSWEPIDLPVTVKNNPIGAPVASIWFRKKVTIPQAWVNQELELSLGVIDAADETFVNGQRVGRTWFDTKEYWLVKRVYAVPASAIIGSEVTVAMRLLKLAYHLAPFGPADKMYLRPRNDPTAEPVSLAGTWKKLKAQDLDAGAQPRACPTLTHDVRTPGSYYHNPTVQYNGLIHPLIPMAMRGVIYYQAESNTTTYVDFRTLMPGLIRSWRADWTAGLKPFLDSRAADAPKVNVPAADFPFGIVYIADYLEQQKTAIEVVARINVRESQAYGGREPNVFFGTAVGVGDGKDVHPRNKREVGRRMAWSAVGNVYGIKDRSYNSPVYRSMEIKGNTIKLSFDHARGLHARGEPPVGFAIAGADRAFYFASARIEGESVVVWSDKVPNPVAVRYAWANNPICNIYNDEQLPLFHFKTDSWDVSQVVIPEDTPIIPEGWQPK
jgi:sialate O-acetylesterase